MLPAVEPRELRRMIDHVFLPPKLPQHADEPKDRSLITLALEALRGFEEIAAEHSDAIVGATTALKNLQRIHRLSDGVTCPETLQAVLCGLEDGQTLAVKLEAQNAAVMISRLNDKIIFEAFELSARNEDVIGTLGRLKRAFPGLAVAVDLKLAAADGTDFFHAISHTIAVMSSEAAPSMQSKSLKKGHKHNEERDTVHPGLVSELLLGGILRGVGSSFPVLGIYKHTRDEVLWQDTLLPWRRSPMWLLIRVLLQLVFVRSPSGSHHLYKEFMIFLTTLLLEHSMELPPESDLLHVMNAKICRRVQKLGTNSSGHRQALHAWVRQTLKVSSNLLSQRWRDIQARETENATSHPIPRYDIGRDASVALPELDNYIHSMQHEVRDIDRSLFSPTSQLLAIRPDSLPKLPRLSAADYHYALSHLQQVEQWVFQHLEQWTTDNDEPSSLGQLSEMLTHYHKLAQELYKDNPEGTSIMLLTTFEIWVACDRLGTMCCPLLKDYDPEIWEGVLENLLLPSEDQMGRLCNIEQYFDRRKRNCTLSALSMFTLSSPNSFAARYFDSSVSHQNLLSSIIARAESERQAKTAEFKRKKRDHARLSLQAKELEHEMEEVVIDRWGDYQEIERRHAKHCQRCRIEQQATALSISIHEWPLPEDKTEVKGVVFELRTPQWFADWRDARQYLIINVLKGKVVKCSLQSSYHLSSGDPHLSSRYYEEDRDRRIGLLSEQKPHVNTHYRDKKISKTHECEVCLRNGLSYQYFDSVDSAFVGPVSRAECVLHACTYRLPEGSQCLQKYLFRPSTQPHGVVPNLVIARQDECPHSMTIEEYKELATLPLGYHLQWPNILLQLTMPEVDFKKPETWLVISQCMYQAGPRGDHSVRQAHLDCHNPRFAHRVFESLRTGLARMRENWDSFRALGIFVDIATRVLALNRAVYESCMAFLTDARTTAMGWLRILQERVQATREPSNRVAFIAKKTAVALVCGCTFDLDQTTLRETLQCRTAASTLIQCSVAEQQGWSDAAETDGFLGLLRFRFKRTLDRARQFLPSNEEGLNEAFGQIWSGYEPSAQGWAITPRTGGGEWLCSTIIPKGANAAVTVHYNLLSGELLVDGAPLDRAPQAYREQSLFHLLFEDEVVEVVPTTVVPGFSFSLLRKFDGLAVYLGMASGSQPGNKLRVRATDGVKTYETIPAEFLRTSYPTHFVEGFVHWFDFQNRTISFRPIGTPWDTQSPANWNMSEPPNDHGWRLMKGEDVVSSLSSPFCQAVAAALAPLAVETDIHVRLKSLQVKVEVPKLRLGFSMQRGQSRLVSKEFPSMEVAGNQSLGTLVGFRNKLVLERSLDGRRKVLVLEGLVSHSLNEGHVVVEVARSSAHNVFAFDVDPDLGRLVDNGSMRCKLLMAHLHALTSFSIPDPFIGMTGTEQALMILRSAAVRSFEQLHQDETNRLGLIARLTPGRAYYPSGMRIMQRVTWTSNLGFLSQHSGFYKAVNEIFDQARRVAVFQPDCLPQFPELPSIDCDLTDRDSIRSSTFRVSGFGAEDHTTAKDRTYQARDRAQHSVRSRNAALTSAFTSGRRVTSFVPTGSKGRLWSLVTQADRMITACSEIKPGDLTYRTEYLEDWQSFVSRNWSALHQWARIGGNVQAHRFALICWIATMAFSETADLQILQALAVCIVSDTAPSVQTADIDTFFPPRGTRCTKPDLHSIFKRHLSNFTSSPESQMARNRNEPKQQFHNRRNEAFHSHQQTAVALYVEALFEQWPRKVPSVPTIRTRLDVHAYVHVARALEDVRQTFEAWHNNGLLFDYLDSLEDFVSSMPHEQGDMIELQVHQSPQVPSRSRYLDVQTLFSSDSPILSEHDACSAAPIVDRRNIVLGASRTKFRLSSLIQSLEKDANDTEYKRQYNQGLQASLAALVDAPNWNSGIKEAPSYEVLVDYFQFCDREVVTAFEAIVQKLTSSTITQEALSTRQFPRICPVFLVQQLSRHRWRQLPDQWRACIVAYGIAMTNLQRARRLIELANSQGDLTREVQNCGHTNWDPYQYPESLLIEIESGLMIRHVQEQITSQMRDPPSGINSTMQLHMGEGKTSMIVPNVAAALADGDRLVRVVVAKPQSRQMAQMLAAKLGGLVDRQVYYMPISRDLRLDASTANQVAAIILQCQSEGGVLLVQPEHVLSLQLMACEANLAGKRDLTTILMSILRLFEAHARDIIDESDENFSTRFELIYTMGKQQMIECSPDRWLLFEQVLDIVRDIAPSIAKALPLSIALSGCATGNFPRIRLLRQDAGALLVESLAQRICDQYICGLPIGTQPLALRRALREYISASEPTDGTIGLVEQSTFWTASTKPLVLLLRGLLAGGVLNFVLSQKRWRVNYGLTTRLPPIRLAVPYRALDCPTLRSEFSHPDVVIILTLLSYYYEGLKDEDLFTAFHDLLQSDAAEFEYQTWLKDGNGVPDGFRQLQSINLEDRESCVRGLFPSLRHAKSVIDYFLSRQIFPKEMREFPSKLSASGWDLGKKTEQILTGFSGTCDSRHLLPLDVTHIDLHATQHTNALVLEYLLQPENGVHLMSTASDTEDITEADRLVATATALDPPVQVILDVGAQVLELSNAEFAVTWLRSCKNLSKEAAVFVNERDEICVIDRSNRIGLLQVSPFAHRMDACLVFLDEVHTRGIDLKLPGDYRALVTLGPRLTKDRLVQACMRMRRLGNGQTVVFCVPDEIQHKIREHLSKPLGDSIQLADILHWSILETHADIRQNIPLWAKQGERFARHAQVWNTAFQTNTDHSLKDLLEVEAQSIEERYLPSSSQKSVHNCHYPLDSMAYKIANRCQSLDGVHVTSRNLQEEQERELSPETEQEQQVQKVPYASPSKHTLHEDVRRFASEGTVVSRSSAYMPLFSALGNTSIARNFDLSQFDGSQQLLATVDFVNTVQKADPDKDLDLFQRPVRWVLTSLRKKSSLVDRVMLISPYEANLLYPVMRTAKNTTLNIYKARCSAAYAPIDRLDLHVVPWRPAAPSVPQTVTVPLGLFAGQLYLSSYEDYLDICDILGLWMGDLTEAMDEEGWKIAADRFILRDGSGRAGGGSTMRQSPVHFMRTLMSKLRRGGQAITRTHMGSLLDGKALRREDFSEEGFTVS